VRFTPSYRGNSTENQGTSATGFVLKGAIAVLVQAIEERTMGALEGLLLMALPAVEQKSSLFHALKQGTAVWVQHIGQEDLFHLGHPDLQERHLCLN
jgi:hypothetical protein